MPRYLAATLISQVSSRGHAAEAVVWTGSFDHSAGELPTPALCASVCDMEGRSFRYLNGRAISAYAAGAIAISEEPHHPAGVCSVRRPWLRSHRDRRLQVRGSNGGNEQHVRYADLHQISRGGDEKKMIAPGMTLENEMRQQGGVRRRRRRQPRLSYASWHRSSVLYQRLKFSPSRVRSRRLRLNWIRP